MVSGSLFVTSRATCSKTVSLGRCIGWRDTFALKRMNLASAGCFDSRCWPGCGIGSGLQIMDSRTAPKIFTIGLAGRLVEVFIP